MKPLTRKGATTMAMDKAWCAKHLARGTPVWCIRRRPRHGGMVVGYVAEDIRGWTQFAGEPVDAFFVQQMVMRDAHAWFGPECEWPREGA